MSTVGGCSQKLLDGEPDLCLEHRIEPYAYHITNRWLDEFFLTGVANANATRGTATPIRHMVQPWMVSMFLDCEHSGMLSCVWHMAHDIGLS